MILCNSLRGILNSILQSFLRNSKFQSQGNKKNKIVCMGLAFIDLSITYSIFAQSILHKFSTTNYSLVVFFGNSALVWYYHPGRMQVTDNHYNDVIMSAMASQITSLTSVYSTVYSGAYQRTHQSPASLVSVKGIHRWPVNSPHKGPITRKMFPFDGVIMMGLRFTSSL